VAELEHALSAHPHSHELTPSRLTLVSPFGQLAAVCFGSRYSPRLTDSAPELFAGQEMGEDALRVLNDYRKHTRISADVNAEAPHVRATVAWSKRV
jgi:hypothetical protein